MAHPGQAGFIAPAAAAAAVLLLLLLGAYACCTTIPCVSLGKHGAPRIHIPRISCLLILQAVPVQRVLSFQLSLQQHCWVLPSPLRLAHRLPSISSSRPSEAQIAATSHTMDRWRLLRDQMCAVRGYEPVAARPYSAAQNGRPSVRKAVTAEMLCLLLWLICNTASAASLPRMCTVVVARRC